MAELFIQISTLIGIIFVGFVSFFAGKSKEINKRLEEEIESENITRKEVNKWNNNTSSDKFKWMQKRFKK